ncbi:hypothetical protein [Janthinobacterium sp.]|uniref:hypothetical protein n=1 Tax=Janthinobacterium sp. TaxID=1871054 RepID=UPI00293D93B4|nr:hypothetical protein [Janthinobacterium sp.]
MNFQNYKIVVGATALLLTQLMAGCALNARTDTASTSSYECMAKPVDGLPTAGSGAYGCHFQLHDPATKATLPNTPYWLDVYAASKPGSPRGEAVATLNGLTDAQGRSGFVRAPFPITAELVRFVKVVGSGPYSRSPRLLRPTDGRPVPGLLYYVKTCEGVFEGTADEQGFAPLFRAKTSCEMTASFYVKKCTPGSQCDGK